MSSRPSSGSLFSNARMPRTRYQGSKWKLCDWIWESVRTLSFHTVLDAFSGTASVSHMFKRRDKAVTCNDVLRFNHQVGLALIENGAETLDDATVETLLCRQNGVAYRDFIERTFQGVYFTDAENRWLDTLCENIRSLPSPARRALAWFALGQAALAKRPYNLFHRRNLYMRTADVPRGFGNKTTWDRSFDELFRRFVAQANDAVFDNGQPCRALCRSAETLEPGYDLVYIDPPYLNGKGVGVDYHAFYHFLEGLVEYDGWADRIDWTSPHRRLIPKTSPWMRRDEIGAAFRALFARFAGSHVVVSYRSDGIPTPAELAAWLSAHKRRVRVLECPRAKKYVLSTNGRARELLLVATDG